MHPNSAAGLTFLLRQILHYNIENKVFTGNRNDERKDQPNFVRLEERRVAEEFIFNWGITSDDSKS
jgi:hypothetical protein